MRLAFNAIWFAVARDPLSHRSAWAALNHRAFCVNAWKIRCCAWRPANWIVAMARERALFKKPVANISAAEFRTSALWLYAQEGLMVGSGASLLASSGQNRQTCLQTAICLDLFGAICYDGREQIVGTDLACQGHSGFRRHNFGSLCLADCADQSNVE
jgi:hypothetical protein